MALQMVRDQDGSATTWLDFTNSVSGDLHQLRYEVRAAMALLNDHPDSDSHDDLVGVRLVLRGIEQRCAALAESVAGACIDRDANALAS